MCSAKDTISVMILSRSSSGLAAQSHSFVELFGCRELDGGASSETAIPVMK
jgi:hypothetical protein